MPENRYHCSSQISIACHRKAVHEGRNIKRVREILGKKQEELAVDLGITQQAVSLLEAKEVIDPKMLEDVAKALRVTPDAIRNFNDEAAVNYIANTFNGNSGNYMNFNPLDKVVELYERMIKERDDLIEALQIINTKYMNHESSAL